ncbi:hypothetical protein BMS3Bbin03_01492 [bacterium BMS3Bbin03]|nr:hypothetical protein BMS3Bbin03_01492 [bacterium BMS3Bbin03]
MKKFYILLVILTSLFWSEFNRAVAGEPFVQYSIYRVDSLDTGYVETRISFQDTLDVQERTKFRLYVSFLGSNSTVNQSNDKLVKGIHTPAFVEWNDTFSDYGWGYTLRVPFTIDTHAPLPKTGKFSFDIVSQILRDNSTDVQLTDTTQFTFWVRPFIHEDSTFSRGLSKSVTWYPSKYPFDQEIISNASSQKLGKELDYHYKRVVVFNHLVNGQRYSYFVRSIFQTDSGLAEIHSDTVYSTQDASPPDTVHLDSLTSYNLKTVHIYWKGVKDSVSYVKAYNIYRMRDNDSLSIHKIATVLSKDTIGTDNSYYLFEDDPKDPPAESFAYQVRAVDAVGNEAFGEFSGPMVKLPIPEITAWYDFSRPDFSWTDFYKKGVENIISVKDTRPGNENQILYPPDSIRFQAVRDSLKYFPIRWDPGKQFFESRYEENGKTTAWIPLSYFPNDSIKYTFDLSNNGGNDGNYINHHQYHFRVQFKDHFGNYSAWSDTVWERQDVFPPDDIDLQMIKPVVQGDTAGYMSITWNKPQDSVTGVAYYFVYRKIGANGAYALIDTTSQITYHDSFDSVGTNQVIYYKVGSVDYVGNQRPMDQIKDEESARCLIGPILNVLGDVISYKGNLYTKANALNYYWENFIADDIYKYEIQVSGAVDSSFYITDPAATNFIWSLPKLGAYMVRVRAIYSIGVQSIWSHPVTVTKAGPPSDIHLAARNDSTPNGHIFLSWNENSDELPIKSYKIYRWPIGNSPELFAVINMDSLYSIQTNFMDTDTTQPVYQCFRYKVIGENLVDLSTESNMDSSYFNRPPKILADQTVITPGEMKLFWERPTPNLSNNFGDVIRVFKEDQPIPVKIDTVFGKNSYSFYEPEKGSVYHFQVMEFPAVITAQMCKNQLVQTAWSQKATVPYLKYPPVQELTAQALPTAPPIDSAPEKGKIYLTWQRKTGQTHVTPITSVSLFRDGQLLAQLTPAVTSYTDSNLTVNHLYAYNVVTIDEFAQKSSSDTVKTKINPYWVFTPQIKSNHETYFKDTLRVRWGWLGADFKWSDDLFGADSAEVSVSIDPKFEHHTASTGWVKNDNHKVSLARPYFVTQNNNDVYLRVRAKDKWGHVSPWSNQYFGLDSAKATYDGVAPQKVAHIRIDSTIASKNVMDLVDVYLSWDATTDNISGMKGYYVRRSDSLVAVIPSSVEDRLHFVDKRVPVDNILDRYWQVFPFDVAGNVQTESDSAFIEIQLYAPLPKPSSFRSFHWDKLNTPFGTTEYWAEIADSNAYFDSKLAEMLHLVSQSGWITSTSYEDSLFQSSDGTAFFRLKVRVQNIESGWSPMVRYPSNGWEIARSSRERETFFKKYNVPKVFRLYQNYPNPFNMITHITYDLPEEGQVKVELWNILGMKIANIENRFHKPGSYTISWNGLNAQGQEVGTGVYFYTIRVSNSGQTLFQKTSKLLLLK